MSNSSKRILALFVTALFLTVSTGIAEARGGGGFGGGGRGGGGGMRGDMGGGFDAGRGGFDAGRGLDAGRGGFDAGRGGFDAGRGGFDPGHGLDGDRPSAFSSPFDAGGRSAFGDNAQRDQAANQTWNQGSSRLATDGGFAQLSGASVRGYASPSRWGTSRANPAVNAARASDVRNHFGRYDAFNHNWWNRYPNAWSRPWMRDRDPWWAWGYGGWGNYGSWWGYGSGYTPTEYDYGDNITYEGDTVYYGSQPAATAEQYYIQADNLATGTSSKSANDDWKSLGVFSLVQGSQTNSTVVFQLAVNKDGAMAGNYYNMLTDEVKPINGAVDKKSMRAAWVVKGVKDVVYDTGFANLLQPQSAILVHFGKSKTQQFSLVRMEKPTTQSSTTSK